MESPIVLLRSDAVEEKFCNEPYFELSDPQCTENFQKTFGEAREAIEKDQLADFKEKVEDLIKLGPPGKDALDVIKDESRKKPLRYPMTLLAYAGYHDRADMINHLILKGAHVDMGKPISRCGTPLLQMFLYAHHQQMKEKLEHPKININIVELFIKRRAHLNRVISAGYSFNCSILTLAISFNLIEIAKLIVENELDPIWGGDGEVCPVFLEYLVFKTHNLLKWLLEEHYSANFKDFVHRLLDEGAFYKPEQVHSFNVVRKNATHAFLLCGHEEAIDCLVEENKIRQQSQPDDILKEVDVFQKTALHLAAEDGDITSVKILLKHCGPDHVNAEDSSSMTPLMLATINRHTEVVKLLQPPSFASRSTDGIKKEIFWALLYGYDSYFEAMHATEEGEERLLASVDNNGNTIAHLAVERGQVSVFKATFPRTHRTDSHSPLFAILSKENSSPQTKTPLQIAIEKGNIDMLNALQERRNERKKQVKKDDILQQQPEIYENRRWKEFWDKESPGLLLYACLHGTVEIVEYFVTKHVSPTTILFKDGYTPLSRAAQTGKSDIVRYLLSIGVPIKGYVAEKEEFLSICINNEWKSFYFKLTETNFQYFETEESTVPVSTIACSDIIEVSIERNSSKDRHPFDVVTRSNRTWKLSATTLEERKRWVFLLQSHTPVPVKNPLMLASRFGHSKCVAVLLKNGASIKIKSKRKYNCLMEAIKAGHSDTAITLLRLIKKHNNDDWLQTIKLCVRKKKKNEKIDPLTMLIKEMPDVAEVVFDQCIKYNNNSVICDYQLLEHYYQHAAEGTPDTESANNIQLVQYPVNSDDNERGNGRNESGGDVVNVAPDEDVDGVTNIPELLDYIYNFAAERKDDLPHHPLALMVKHKQQKLLKHPLISRYISCKWWKLSWILFTYLAFYIIFLIALTTFSIITPRPAPENKFCPRNETSDHVEDIKDTCEEPDKEDRIVFIFLAAIVMVLSVVFFVSHVVTTLIIMWIKPGWPTCPAVIEAILRSFTFIFTFIFVFGFHNDCWCAPPWQWQIGALAVFMAYINLLMLLKGVPLLNLGLYINMLLNIVIEFIKLIILPILLILSFAFPFYMLFVRDADSTESVGILKAFFTPARSLIKTTTQTAGGADFEAIFNAGTLLYQPVAYILFVVFLVVMPVLFRTMLVGLAVGTAEKAHKNAEFKEIELQVNYIIVVGILRCHCSELSSRKYKKDDEKDYETLVKMVKEKNNELKDNSAKMETDNSRIDHSQQAMKITNIQSDIEVMKETQSAMQSDVKEMKDGLHTLQSQMNEILKKWKPA